MARKVVRRMRSLLFVLMAASASATVVPDVRRAIAADDFATAERLVRENQRVEGTNPDNTLAQSWLGRGALAAKRYDAAEKYAVEAKRQALLQLRKRKLDAEPNLPLALGAAIEVQSQVTAARGERDQAVQYLRGEIATYRGTSIIARLRKNENLLSLEGKRLPRLEGVPASALTGKPVLLFFWAHWCSDCKSMSDDLVRLKAEFPNLAIVAPTQTYGYAEAGREVGQAEETAYIGKIWKEFYPGSAGVPTPVSKLNFDNFGSSTTPTLVLTDKAGVVKLYHPGKMPYDELAKLVRTVVKP